MATNVSIWVLSFFFLLGCVRGFSIKLIPRDSLESPLYEKNLTHKERFKKMVDITVSRSSRSKLNKDTIQPAIERSYPSDYYMVSFTIGTPGDHFHLMVDTGCPITWVQAHSCTKCFPIMDGSFNFSRSSTFAYIGCEDGNCISCDDDYVLCEYHAEYGQNSHSETRGLIAKDDFTFISDTGGQEKVKMLFGVGLKNRISLDEENQMAGIFGLASGEYSFLSQLPYSMRRFSYCLPPDYSYSSTINFGESVYVPKDVKVQTTPLILRDGYWLNCIGISVNGKDIGLPKKAFTSGFLIDSGAPFTQLVPGIYNLLRNVLSDYFKWFRRIPNLRLCYSLPSEDFDNFPDITFHFQGANFTLESKGAFTIEEDVFCLAIISTEEDSFYSIFGARSQTDHVIIHDINKKQLSFYPERCS